MKEEGKLNTNEVNNDNPISNTDWSYDFNFSGQVKEEIPATPVVQPVEVIVPVIPVINSEPEVILPVVPVIPAEVLQPTEQEFVLPTESAPVTPVQSAPAINPTTTEPTIVVPVAITPVFVKPIENKVEEVLDEYQIKNEIVKEKTMNKKKKAFMFFIFAIIIAFIVFLPMIFQMMK